MAYPTFDGFELQTDNYIVEDIVYRTIPERAVEYEKIARRPGARVLSSDFGVRKVTMSGHIIADTVNELRTYIDNLHANVTRKVSGMLYMESDRSATATVTNVAISDPHYSQTFVPFDIEFLLADPFFYGTQQVLSWTIASGTASMSDTITISGSVFAEPIISYFAPDNTGYTTTSGIAISYPYTGETITWSGGNPTTLAYSDNVVFDYVNHKILQGSTEKDIEGVFSRWEPGEVAFSVTFSGSTQGGSVSFAYQPRYL